MKTGEWDELLKINTSTQIFQSCYVIKQEILTYYKQ